MGRMKLVDIFLKNPIKKNFDAIKNDGIALSFVYKKLHDKTKLTKFIKTFEDWKSVYTKTVGELELFSFHKMMELANSVEEWSIIKNRASHLLTELEYQNLENLEMLFLQKAG